MRILPLVLAAGLVAVPLVSSSVFAAAPVEDYQTLSRGLVQDGQAALAQEDAEMAQRHFERALVANPANVAAFVGLGQAHEAQGMVAKGLKYYRQALAIEPNNLSALEAQALAFLQRNLYDEAELNRDKLKRLCRAGCAALDAVETALTRYRAMSDEPPGAAAESGR